MQMMEKAYFTNDHLKETPVLCTPPTAALNQRSYVSEIEAMTWYELFTAFFLCVFIAIFLYYRRAHSYFKQRRVPTPTPYFPFGNIVQVVLQKQSINDKICELYRTFKEKGRRFGGLYFVAQPVFVPIDLDLVKNILVKDFDHFEDRGIYYDEENDPVSAHLFSLHGEKWKTLRSKLTPAFTAGKIKYMFDTIAKSGREILTILDSSDAVEIKDVLARFTTDVIGTCAFGIECNSLKNPDAEFRQMGIRAFTHTVGDFIRNVVIRNSPHLAKVLGLSVFPKDVSNFFKNVIEETVAYRQTNSISRNDFLQLLIRLKNGEQIDDTKRDSCEALTLDEVSAQAFIFFLAGFETTSTSLGFTVLEIALNTTVQEKARNEVEEMFEKHKDLNYECIAEMQYLETIIQESLRKYPPAPAYLRKCTKDYKIPGSDVVIEEGTTLVIPTMAMHRDPDFYPNPDVFDPERFNETNRRTIKDCTYIPFGDGPRKCIGMRFAMIQSKLVLALLIKNFKFTISPKMKLPLKMATSGIVLAPVGGIWIKLQKIG